MTAYKKYTIQRFGSFLLHSEDLDPVYNTLNAMLEKGLIKENQLKRWLLAYIYFYDVGVASFLSEAEGVEFFDKMHIAAFNEQEVPFIGGRWKRASERRHFRGAAATDAVNKLRNMLNETPEQFFHSVPDYKVVAYADFSKQMLKYPLIGPWAAFKLADISERVLGINVNFNHAEIFMFKDPTQAAIRLWREHHGFDDKVIPKDIPKTLTAITQGLLASFKSYSVKFSPLNQYYQQNPMDETANYRRLSLAEVETVLCKWKSHMNGHYPLLNDTLAIRKDSAFFIPISTTAGHFHSCVPKKVEESEATSVAELLYCPQK